MWIRRKSPASRASRWRITFAAGKRSIGFSSRPRGRRKIEKPAGETFWGGYSGYFSDPDGYLWEIAWGAFEIRDDGSLVVT